MVYNGTYSGMNTSLCAPHFYLPTVGYTLCAVEKGTFMEDQDIGQIFNFNAQRGSNTILWIRCDECE